ncbi:MAG: DUF1553 domain-containing protein [Planctomycetaceae bacterium]|jgi:hypothetical protein|nr:DUF1553 domain-containing protein [Planctomycetaceae bacterium]
MFRISVIFIGIVLFFPLLNTHAQQSPNGRREQSSLQQSSLQQSFLQQLILAKMSSQNPFDSKFDFKPKNKIDVLIAASLKRYKREPSKLCSDEVFIRRVYLDTIGTLPEVQAVRDFLADEKTDKRSQLIDCLLARDEFIDYWTLKWCDILRVKAEFPINLWPNGAMTYYRWIHEAVRTEMPYHQFARTLLTADGSNFRDGASNFYRAVPQKDAETLAENVALTFLGVRTGAWTPEKLQQLSVFFSRIGYKETAEWKEEIVFWIRKPLDSPEVVFPDGTKGTIRQDQDPREVFADWLVSPSNKGFNQNIANRIWFWLFGYGLVHESDDFRPDNLPVHPEVLDYLCQELIDSDYCLKHLYRLILNSSTYQQSSIPNSKNPNNDPKITELFASYPIRRMEAEVLQDALSQIFGIPVVYSSEVPEPFTNIPAQYRTIMLPDASITSSFLEMFGRPTRDTGMESDRNNGVTESQQLFMLNSTEVNNWVMKFLLNYRNINRKPEEVRKMIDDIWLRFLSRYPTASELRITAEELRQQEKIGGQKVQDIVWALLNTKEFLCRH